MTSYPRGLTLANTGKRPMVRPTLLQERLDLPWWLDPVVVRGCFPHWVAVLTILFSLRLPSRPLPDGGKTSEKLRNPISNAHHSIPGSHTWCSNWDIRSEQQRGCYNPTSNEGISERWETSYRGRFLVQVVLVFRYDASWLLQWGDSSVSWP